MGRTKILWGLHLFISTYFPRLSKPRYLFVSKRASFDPLQVKLPNLENYHDTTHFNLPNSKTSRPPQKAYCKTAKASEAKSGLGSMDIWGQLIPICWHSLQTYLAFAETCKNVLGQTKGVKMVKLTNVEKSCKKSSRRGHLRIQPQFLRTRCNFFTKGIDNCCCKVSHL